MRIYGVSSIDKGRREIVTDCIAAVFTGRMVRTSQCSFKRGHGPDGLYCKRHAKMLANGRHLWKASNE